MHLAATPRAILGWAIQRSIQSNVLYKKAHTLAKNFPISKYNSFKTPNRVYSKLYIFWYPNRLFHIKTGSDAQQQQDCAPCFMKAISVIDEQPSMFQRVAIPEIQSPFKSNNDRVLLHQPSPIDVWQHVDRWHWNGCMPHK